MTTKLYYQDAYQFSFSSVVLSCTPKGENWIVILRETAFFPEGGGQPADAGTLDGAAVLDVHEKNGDILHLCTKEIPAGTIVRGEVDAETRLRRMQNHTGEHIFSGIVCGRFGCSNVGFHIGEAFMTIDYDREFTEEELRESERLANEAVRANLEVRCWFPDREALASISYRSKKELEGEVRIVEIPGVDCCACCAPHVRRTGEVGVVKLLEVERHRGGTRLTMLCGMDAWENYCLRQQSVAEISVLLSAKRDQVTAAVERLLEEKEALKEKAAALSRENISLKAEKIQETEGNLCVFLEDSDEIAARELMNLLKEKCGGYAAVFFPAETGWRYCIGSTTLDMRKAASAINAGIDGRGGGRPEMIQGRASETREVIRHFVEKTVM